MRKWRDGTGAAALSQADFPNRGPTMNQAGIRLLFAIAALYDFAIGLMFLLNGRGLFDSTGVPQPNHWGYIQFGALLLMVFGLMFAAVALNPHRNRNLIPFGILLKIAYVGLVGYYWANGGIPWLFQPFLFIDLVMLLLFAVAYMALGRVSQANLRL
jgi:hypothetical protein